MLQGGLKIWECSEDLARHLHEAAAARLEDRRVCELGCGAGLPGLYALKHGAQGERSRFVTHFLHIYKQDFALLNKNVRSIHTL